MGNDFNVVILVFHGDRKVLSSLETNYLIIVRINHLIIGTRKFFKIVNIFISLFDSSDFIVKEFTPWKSCWYLFKFESIAVLPCLIIVNLSLLELYRESWVVIFTISVGLQASIKLLEVSAFSFKGALSGLRHFLVVESPLKIMKNAFYFTL